GRERGAPRAGLRAHGARLKRAGRYALAGTGLALGAPLGWLVLRGAAFDLSRVQALAASDRDVLLYLMVGTGLAFTVFGAALGRVSDLLAQRNDQLEALARTDALTGLANRRAFQDRLELELARAARSGEPLSLVMVDL